ncbi:MAG: hypothetical protein IKS45_10195 [Thermoguttaceae bacterium]|nr:hypothetical protein [Thermoguttaceae bacterium]MBR6436868.1 hypothetical protein [Thermoguttaceae bacterium]
MTRSIPSIIVLALMCFTISYGLVRFPEAGILDAAPTQSTSYVVHTSNLQPTDGSALQPIESPASTLPETTVSSDDLFESQPSLTAKTSSRSAGVDASDKPVENAAENTTPEQGADSETADANANPADNASAADAPADKSESASEKADSDIAELPGLDSASTEQADTMKEQTDTMTLIDIPEDDYSIHDDEMPIETDQDPLPPLDSFDSDVPQIQVPSNPSDVEQTFAPEQEMEPAPEPAIDSDFDMTPEQEQSVDDYWDTYLNNELSDKAPKAEAPAKTDNSSNVSQSGSSNEKQNDVTAAPAAIQSDPNAQVIPPRNREQKSANTGALTLPALDEPQTPAPSANQPETGTIPLESFPLDSAAVQPVNYTSETLQEPRDSFGFNIPAVGPIVVRRLPSVENSVDPIYNNAQLDRFAL